MKRLWVFVLVFAAAVGIGVLIQKDPGYALFSYHDTSVEMPLWVAVLFLLFIIVIVMGLLSFLSLIFSNRLAQWWRKRKLTIARLNTQKGLIQFSEGQWKNAENLLKKSARNSESPYLNYIFSAKAADALHAFDRSQQYLKLAFNASGGSKLGAKLTEAKLQLKDKNYEQCVALLQHLHSDFPTHKEILKELAILYEKVGDWHSLFVLLPELKKSDFFANKDDELVFEQKLYSKLFPWFKNNIADLKEFWHHAPKTVTKNPDCILAYAKILNDHKLPDLAEKEVHSYLTKNWDDGLVNLYGLITGPSVKKQLAFAESLLTKKQDNAILFLTLGRLCLKNQLWGKARDYLEHSVRLKPSAEGYALLAQLMTRLGEGQKREEYLKKGLNLFVDEEL